MKDLNSYSVSVSSSPFYPTDLFCICLESGMGGGAGGRPSSKHPATRSLPFRSLPLTLTCRILLTILQSRLLPLELPFLIYLPFFIIAFASLCLIFLLTLLFSSFPLAVAAPSVPCRYFSRLLHFASSTSSSFDH